MLRDLRGFLAAAVIAATVSAHAAPARAEAISGTVGDSSVPVVIDALVMRPLGFVVMCAGFVTFAIASPIIAVTRPTDIHKPFKTLVVLPARYVFVDPLGHHPDRTDAEYAGTVQ